MPDRATPGQPAGEQTAPKGRDLGGPRPDVGSGRPLIGREHELDLLVEAFVAARRGELRRVLLRGRDGSGTRALLTGLRSALGTRGLAHRWATTQVHPGDAAYAALAGLLATGSHGRIQGLESLFVDLDLVPVESRTAVVGDRLARGLAPSSQLPLVLVVEGIQHLDPLARAALATTMRSLRQTPTLAIVTSSSAVDWPADVAIPLAPLPRAAAEQLARSVAPDDPDRAALLVDLSGGLPGLLVALSRWPDPRIPAIDQLTGLHPRAAALTLAIGMADGHLTDLELLAAAEAPDGLIDALAEHGVLRRDESATRGRSAAGAWQAAARSATTPADLRQVARRLADALRRADAPPRLWAAALTAAGADEEAASAWREAADASGADADDRAACLVRAVELSGVPEPALVRSTVDALLGVGRAEVAHEQITRGLAALPRRAVAARASLLTRERRALLQLGRITEAEHALAEATGILPDDVPDGDADLARSLAEVATAQSMAMALDNPSTAGARAELACRAARQIDDPAVLAGAYGALALTQGLAGDGRASLESFDRALAWAEECGDHALEVRIAANRIFVLWRSGRLVAMESAITAELGRLADSGLAEAAGGQLLVGRAVVLHALGRWGELTDHLEQTLAHPERLSAQVELLLRLQAVELAADLGRIADARSGLATLAGWPGARDPEVAYELMAVRLATEMLAGDPARSEVTALVAEAATLSDELAADPFAAARVRVAALRLLGWSSQRPGGPLGAEPFPDGAGAGQPIGGDQTVDPPVERPASRGVPTPGEDASAKAAPSIPAELAALLAEERAWRSGSGWGEASAAWAALPMPYRRAWADLCGAHARARAGDPQGALDLAEESRRTAERLAALPLRGASERLARQLGKRASRTEGTLTARERDVVGQVALGRTNREIARTLGMSDRTVAVHLTRIFAKLGAGTRGEVAHIARRRGLIDP